MQLIPRALLPFLPHGVNHMFNCSSPDLLYMSAERWKQELTLQCRPPFPHFLLHLLPGLLIACITESPRAVPKFRLFRRRSKIYMCQYLGNLGVSVLEVYEQLDR